MVYPARRIVGPTETIDAIARGAIDGHFSAPSYFIGLDPAFALLGDTLAAYENPRQRDEWFEKGGGL